MSEDEILRDNGFHWGLGEPDEFVPAGTYVIVEPDGDDA